MERKATRFEIRLPPDLADQLDQLRRQYADLPPRAEAARRAMVGGVRILRWLEANSSVLDAIEKGHIRVRHGDGQRVEDVTDAEVERLQSANAELVILLRSLLQESEG